MPAILILIIGLVGGGEPIVIRMPAPSVEACGHAAELFMANITPASGKMQIICQPAERPAAKPPGVGI